MGDTINPPLNSQAITTGPIAERPNWVSLWCVVAASGVYFCVYGFRKPFTAAGFAELTIAGLDTKTLLVISQVFGYAASKFLGIKVVSEATPQRRVVLLLGLVAVAWATLLLFALTPSPWNAVWLFGNGLMLGMVFGLVLGFLEGRRHTEALAAALCGSFILADGVTKSVGAALLDSGVPERWMPVVAGLLFAAPLAVFAWMLTRTPGPSLEDVTARNERRPMNGLQRWAFFRRYAIGLTLVVLIYLLITILRSVRADFAREVWIGLQGEVRPNAFALSEAVVAVTTLVLTGATVLIRDNRRTFFAGLGMAGFGVVLVGAALTAWGARTVSPFAFMVLLGVGLYLPYLIVHTTLFERLLAATRDHGNVGFLMYLADSFGYLGYVGVLLARPLLGKTDNFLMFFTSLSWAVVAGCLILLGPCWLAFAIHPALRRKGEHA